MNGIAHANLVGATEGFFVAFVVFSQVRRRHANLWLGLFVLCSALLCTQEAIFRSDLPLAYPDAMYWVEGLILAMGPLLYIYLHAFTGRPIRWRWGWLHFIPAGLLCLLQWSWHLLPREAKLRDIHANRTDTTGLDPFMVLIAIQWLSYLCISFWYLYRLSEAMKQVSSNLDRLSFLWLKRVLIVVIGLYLVWLPTVAPGNQWALLAIALALPTAIYLLAAAALRTPELFAPSAPPPVTPTRDQLHPATQAQEPDPMPLEVEVEEDSITDEKYRKARLPEGLLQQYEQRLRVGMEVQRFFLDPELSLARLAEQIGMSAHHLSQILNERLGLRFCDYINACRVEEAQRLLSDPTLAQTPVLTLAMQAGFASKATFNAVFKRSTGFTPTVWRGNILQKKAS